MELYGIFFYNLLQVVSTIHVVFANPEVYRNISSSLIQFFTDENISLVSGIMIIGLYSSNKSSASQVNLKIILVSLIY